MRSSVVRFAVALCCGALCCGDVAHAPEAVVGASQLPSARETMARILLYSKLKAPRYMYKAIGVHKEEGFWEHMGAVSLRTPPKKDDTSGLWCYPIEWEDGTEDTRLWPLGDKKFCIRNA